MISNQHTNWKFILIVLILAILVGGGILAWQYFGMPREEVKAPEEKVPEEVVEDETADWKTFESPMMRFSIKYPSEAEVTVDYIGEHGAILDLWRTHIWLPDNWFLEPKLGRPEIIIESWTKFREESVSFQDHVNHEEETFREHFLRLGMFSEVKKETVILDNVSATKFLIVNKIKSALIGDDIRGIDVYVQHKERMYHIIGGITFKNEAIYLPILNQMLSTFRFLPPQ